jgi:hypothetical protein
MRKVMNFLPAVVVALIFGSLAMWWGVTSVFEGYVSSTWSKTTGTIQESHIDRTWSSGPPRGGSGYSYTPAIVYAYTINGQTYRNSKIGTREAWNAETSQQVINAYPLGSQRSVYYSPSDPVQSMLMPGLHRASFFGIILGLLIFSFGAFFGTIGYVASRDSTYDSGAYSFDWNSTPGRGIGFLAIACEFGLLFWVLQ